MNRAVQSKQFIRIAVTTLAIACVGILLAPPVSHWHRERLAQQLESRLASVDDNSVKIVLRQLAALGDSAIEPLIAASASERAVVADLARRIVEEKLAAWTFAADSNSPVDVASSATLLASALAGFSPEYGRTGQLWAERSALTLLELAENLPARQTRLLLEDCSRVLAAIPARGPRMRTMDRTAATTIQSSPNNLHAPTPNLDTLTRASEGSLEVLARVKTKDALGLESHLTRVPSGKTEEWSTARDSANPDSNWSPDWHQHESRAPVNSATTTEVSRRIDERQNRPAVQQVVDIPSPQEMAEERNRLNSLATEELLLRLPEAGFHEAGIIRHVLLKRGIGDKELALRQLLSSRDVSDRLDLIQEVSNLQAASARRLLHALLRDESAEVRLGALAALGTTTDAEISEVARELAERDSDRRVAELASRLLKQARQ